MTVTVDPSQTHFCYSKTVYPVHVVMSLVCSLSIHTLTCFYPPDVLQPVRLLLLAALTVESGLHSPAQGVVRPVPAFRPERLGSFPSDPHGASECLASLHKDLMCSPCLLRSVWGELCAELHPPVALSLICWWPSVVPSSVEPLSAHRGFHATIRLRHSPACGMGRRTGARRTVHHVIQGSAHVCNLCQGPTG